jgi:hypothetical protein
MRLHAGMRINGRSETELSSVKEHDYEAIFSSTRTYEVTAKIAHGIFGSEKFKGVGNTNEEAHRDCYNAWNDYVAKSDRDAEQEQQRLNEKSRGPERMK